MDTQAYKLGAMQAVQDATAPERGFGIGAGLGLGASLPLAFLIGKANWPMWLKLLVGSSLGPVGVLGGGAAGYGIGKLLENNP
jgi:hypothetical protein